MLTLAVFLASFVTNQDRPRADDRDRGATAVEYGLMIALIAAVIVGAVFVLGGTVKCSFQKTNTAVAAPSATAPPAACP